MPRTTEEEELGELKEWRWEVYPSFNKAPMVIIIITTITCPDEISNLSFQYHIDVFKHIFTAVKLKWSPASSAMDSWLCLRYLWFKKLVGVISDSSLCPFAGSLGWERFYWRRSKTGESQKCQSKDAWAGVCAAPHTGPKQWHAQTVGAPQVVLAHQGASFSSFKNGTYRSPELYST